MYNILDDRSFDFNKRVQYNFGGGELSSDGGLLLLKEFIHKIGFEKVVKEVFHTTDTASYRKHKDTENLMQRIYQVFAGYFNDNDADEIIKDPVMCTVLDKPGLASQPTMSRFFNRLDEKSLEQFERIHKAMRRTVMTIRKQDMVLLDLDSTLLNTYGEQEGEGFNYHYQAHGYHPLLCYDGLNGDLLKCQLRDGTQYCSNGAAEFVRSLLQEFMDEYLGVKTFFRGDSGFAAPEIYEICETNGCGYAIRLKINSTLSALASEITSELDDLTQKNKVDYAVCYGEFEYKAHTWKYPRRVVCKVEKPANQFTYMYTFVVTNMDTGISPEKIIAFYCNRGSMENLIKESKLGFDFSCMSSHSKIVNAGRLQICMLAYNLFVWFKSLVLPEDLRKAQIDTIRIKLLKIAVRFIRSGRYLKYRFCSSFPYKSEFCETLENIRRLPVPG